jgi:hypothetical protein
MTSKASASSEVNSLYKPLLGNEIRLITIKPSPKPKGKAKTTNAPIHCTLEHYPLIEPTESKVLKEKLDALEDCWDYPPSKLDFQVFDETLGKPFSHYEWRHRTSFGVKKKAVHGRYPWGDYVALSYTWNDPKDTEQIDANDAPKDTERIDANDAPKDTEQIYVNDAPQDTERIYVNDVPKDVTTNLEAALRVLREKGPIEAGIKIWIDALCINQQDDEEKGVQVRRMRDIYQKAYVIHALSSCKVIAK